jgi:hypothetical protein
MRQRCVSHSARRFFSQSRAKEAQRAQRGFRGLPKEGHVFCQGRKAGNRWVREVCLAKGRTVFLANGEKVFLAECGKIFSQRMAMEAQRWFSGLEMNFIEFAMNEIIGDLKNHNFSNISIGNSVASEITGSDNPISFIFFAMF